MLLSKSTFRAAACAAAFLFAPSIASAQSPFGGFYFGGHAGYSELFESEVDLAGFGGGLHAGYNVQSGSMVYGVEGDFSWTDISDSLTDDDVTVDFGFNHMASVRGRIGYATPSALFYATAGYAWTEFEVSATDGVNSASASFDFSGFVGGAGMEYKFSTNLSGRVEGLYYTLSGDAFEGIEFDGDFGTVRAGLSYHLN